MQFAKDSFFVHLRDRLQSVNPDRVITFNGALRLALVVVENEPPVPEPLPETFYLRWGSARVITRALPGQRPLMAMDVQISYHTRGAAAQAHVDRGRALGALDAELLAICAAGSVGKFDHTQLPLVALNSRLFWAPPRFGEVEAVGDELRRTASLTIFFFPEVTAA